MESSDPKRDLLRHTVATLAYRGGKRYVTLLIRLRLSELRKQPAHPRRFWPTSVICSIGRCRSRKALRPGRMQNQNHGGRRSNAFTPRSGASMSTSLRATNSVVRASVCFREQSPIHLRTSVRSQCYGG